MSTNIRIATLNVDWWTRPTSLKDHLKLIAELEIDLLAIQEGQYDTVDKLVSELNDIEPQNSTYKWSHCSKQLLGISNSIITRYPIIAKTDCVWNWNHFDCKARKEERCAVMIKILINNKIVSIMCTHLDHINEETRLSQMRHFIGNILIDDNDEEKKEKIYADIICGDFNSLSRSDYTQTEWQSIADIRKENSWELPMGTVMNDLLLNNGYYDSLPYVLKRQFYELNYLKKMDNSNDKTSNKNVMKFEELCAKIDFIKWVKYEQYKDELDFDLNKMCFEYYKKNGWQYTSRYYTRIDYVLLSKDLISNVVDVGFHDTMNCVLDDELKVYKNNLTDHNLYWCDIRIDK